MKAVDIIEAHFPNCEWRDTGLEYDGFVGDELFIGGYATGFSKRSLQERANDLGCMTDSFFMKKVLNMEAASFDPEKELIAIIEAEYYRKLVAVIIDCANKLVPTREQRQYLYVDRESLSKTGRDHLDWVLEQPEYKEHLK